MAPQVDDARVEVIFHVDPAGRALEAAGAAAGHDRMLAAAVDLPIIAVLCGEAIGRIERAARQFGVAVHQTTDEPLRAHVLVHPARGLDRDGPLADEPAPLVDNLTPVLQRIHRVTYEQTHRIDLHGHFDRADGLRLFHGHPRSGFLFVNAFAGTEVWWLLVGVDDATGDVTSTHVIATDSFDMAGTRSTHLRSP